MIRLTIVLTLCALCVGCGGGGDEARKFDVSGTVNYKGNPVKFGTVIFDPDRTKGNSGPQGIADIRDGKYDTSGRIGVSGGAYNVVINGYNEQPNVNDESSSVKPLFPEFRKAIDLPQSSTTMNFDIP